MSSVEDIFQKAVELPIKARIELTELLIESLAEDVNPEIAEAQLAEVRRRMAEVEAGEVQLMPGDEILVRARKLLTNS